MALISLSDWIDQHGDEPQVANDEIPSTLTVSAAFERTFPISDYRMNAVRPSGSEIADTRTRLL